MNVVLMVDQRRYVIYCPRYKEADLGVLIATLDDDAGDLGASTNITHTFCTLY